MDGCVLFSNLVVLSTGAEEQRKSNSMTGFPDASGYSDSSNLGSTNREKISDPQVSMAGSNSGRNSSLS